MGKSSKVTVGHKYNMGEHLVLGQGPWDYIGDINLEDRTAWEGKCEGGQIYVDAETLFGGSADEWVPESTLDTITKPDNSDADGFSGYIDIEMGYPTQTKNAYLQKVLGTLIPAFRGVVSVILNQCYIGNSEYPKPLSFLGSRIHVKEWGDPQWYDEKAEIRNAYSYVEETLEYSTIFDYQILNYIVDTSTPEAIAAIVIPTSGYAPDGQAPFGRESTGGSLIPVYPIETLWAYNTSLWLKKIIYSNGTSISIEGYVENAAAFYIDGVLVYSVNLNNDQSATASGIPYSASIPVSEGQHTLHILVLDEEDGPGADPVAQDNTYFYCVIGAFAPANYQADMNPAHIIRECDTSRRWGLGHPSYDINDTEFMTAADQLFAEGMGISLFWDRQKPVDEFIDDIVRHIDAAHYVDRTGRFTLKLIRADYDIDELIVLDESNVIRVDRAASTPPDELINAVTVIWDDAATEKEASVQVADPALVQRQGRINSTTVRYPGFSNQSVAIRAAMRDLRALSNSLYTFEIIVQSGVAIELHIGAPFILNLPKHNAYNMVVRVADIKSGDGRKNEIRIVCTQDVFALPDQPIMVTSPGVGWEDPRQPAAPVAAQLTFEMPYYELVQSLGQSVVDTNLTDPMVSALGVAAVRASSTDINAQIMVDSGAGYRAADELEFCPTALLATVMTYTTIEIEFTSDVDIDLVRVGSHAQIDDELVVIVEIDFDERNATLGRGVLDTLPALHAVGARIWFWDFYTASDLQTYVDGQAVDVKVLPNASSGRLPITAAAAQSIEFTGRAARPYPPGKLLINGDAYPATIGELDGLSLTWAHRDRTLQTAGTLQDTNVGDIGPEPGTIYNVRIYGDADVLLRDVPGIADNFYNYTTEMEGDDLESGTVAIDEFWPKVSLLLNMNGTNSNTVFIDSSPNFAAVFGNTQISTAQFKYGGVSGYFDGSGDYLSFADSENWNFGAGAVVIEGWIRPTTTATAREIIAQRSTADNNNFWLLRVTSSAKIQLTAVSGGSTITNITSNGTVAANTWSHVAAVRSSGTWKIWINGVNSDAVSTNSTSAWPNVGYPLLIGAGDEISNYFSGYIDDLRITKGAARYTSAFTPPNQLGELVKPADFGACTALLNFELMTAAETSSEALQSGDYAKNYADIPPFWSLTLYGEVGDFAGTTIDDTDSKFGSSCGLGVYLRARDEFGLALPGDGSSPVGSMTWDAWIKIPSSFSATGYVHEIFSYYGLWKLGVQTLGSHWFDVDGGLGGGGVSHPSIAESTTTDVWVHYAVTMTQTLIVPAPGSGSLVENVCKLYRNGVLFLTTTAQVPVASACRAYDFNVSATFKIDELRIRRGLHYTGNFTPESSPVLTVDPYWANTVLLMPFNNEYGTTAFENIAPITKTLTAHGNAQISTAQFKYGIAAGLFDGTGDYLSTTHNILHSIQSGDFTIEAWVYRNVSGALHYIVSKRPSGATATGWEWRINSTDLLQFLHVGGSSLVSTTTVPAGQWVHIATVRNGTTVTHYIDGVASGSGTFTNGTENTADTLKVGIGGDLSGSFSGYIDDVRITKGASRYTADFAPPNAELGKYIAVPGDLSTSLTFELESEREGLVSYQKHRLTVVRS